MSAANQFNVGDRVTLIPYQHKGKVATVKYFGSIGRKFGTWVGLELDEATGDCDGLVGGEQLFECEPNFGLVLRNTQVKIYDPNAPAPSRPRPKPSAIEESKDPAVDVGSPLLTPKKKGEESLLTDDSQSALLEKVNQLVAQKKVPTEDTEAKDSKNKGWREKLEKLKAKKVEQKQ